MSGAKPLTMEATAEERRVLETVAEILGAGTLVVLVLLVYAALRSWRVEATLKASTRSSAISVAAGFSALGVSASAAAILDGPGVLAVHLRGRQLWRRPIARVSVEAVLLWIDEQLSKPVPQRESRLGRVLGRVRQWLLPRTDLSALPDLGLRLVGGLRAPSLGGAITCGFADPAVTGGVAAWLYPLAGMLAPFGLVDVSMDWSGKDLIEADVEASCGVVPARAIYETLRFTRRHVHPLRKATVSPPVPSTLHT